MSLSDNGKRGAALVALTLIALCGRTTAQETPPQAGADSIRQLAAEAPLCMQFRGATAEECRRWQREFAAQLRLLLGPHAPPKQWRIVVERTVTLADHHRD